MKTLNIRCLYCDYIQLGKCKGKGTIPKSGCLMVKPESKKGSASHERV